MRLVKRNFSTNLGKPGDDLGHVSRLLFELSRR